MLLLFSAESMHNISKIQHHVGTQCCGQCRMWEIVTELFFVVSTKDTWSIWERCQGWAYGIEQRKKFIPNTTDWCSGIALRRGVNTMIVLSCFLKWIFFQFSCVATTCELSSVFSLMLSTQRLERLQGEYEARLEDAEVVRIQWLALLLFCFLCATWNRNFIHNTTASSDCAPKRRVFCVPWLCTFHSWYHHATTWKQGSRAKVQLVVFTRIESNWWLTFSWKYMRVCLFAKGVRIWKPAMCFLPFAVWMRKMKQKVH